MIDFESVWGDGSKKRVRDGASAAVGTVATALAVDAAVAAGCTAAACTVAAPLVVGLAAAAATAVVVDRLWDAIF